MLIKNVSVGVGKVRIFLLIIFRGVISCFYRLHFFFTMNYEWRMWLLRCYLFILYWNRNVNKGNLTKICSLSVFDGVYKNKKMQKMLFWQMQMHMRRNFPLEFFFCFWCWTRKLRIMFNYNHLYFKKILKNSVQVLLGKS